MAPEETRMMSLPVRTSSATSSASESSHVDLSVPSARSTSRLEPILTTMRRALVHSARSPDALPRSAGAGRLFLSMCSLAAVGLEAFCQNAYQIWVRLDQPGAGAASSTAATGPGQKGAGA